MATIGKIKPNIYEIPEQNGGPPETDNAGDHLVRQKAALSGKSLSSVTHCLIDCPDQS
ncbi:MAG: hypothetical protein Q8N89_02235 [Azonexus sp.]|nr:hypothetical protein [Azonexus sp.]